jgi:hypothetical protein
MVSSSQSNGSSRPNQYPEFFTPKELAARLKIKPNTLATWRLKGDGPPFKKLSSTRNGLVRYPTAGVLEYEKSLGLASNTSAKPKPSDTKAPSLQALPSMRSIHSKAEAERQLALGRRVTSALIETEHSKEWLYMVEDPDGLPMPEKITNDVPLPKKLKLKVVSA